MKEILLRYTAYNVWANKQISETLRSLSIEEAERELGGSFPSVRKTITHLWLAESVWIQRLKMAEHILIPADDGTADLGELCDNWIGCSQAISDFTEKIHDDRGLEHQFHYTNIKGEHQKSAVWECLQHVGNHSTFHRGQLINYLRMLGKTNIPSTDFITSCRKK